jgi:hypothetical protein
VDAVAAGFAAGSTTLVDWDDRVALAAPQAAAADSPMVSTAPAAIKVMNRAVAK